MDDENNNRIPCESLQTTVTSLSIKQKVCGKVKAVLFNHEV